MRRAAALILIAGLTLAVLAQLSYLESRPGWSAHLFDGRMGNSDPIRVEWRSRIGTIWLAQAVGAGGHTALWFAAWFGLSAFAWFLARGPRCIAPVALLTAGTLATFYPQVFCGTTACEGPVLFWFTLAAITRRRATLWWPVLGLVAIPFKQTGAVLVVVAALLWFRDGDRLRAVLLLAVGAGLGWLCAHLGGGPATAAVTTHSLHPKSYPADNLRHLREAPWAVALICGGTVLAGILTARGPALLAALILVGAVFCMGQMWEPRIWLEVVALSAGVLADRKEA